MLQTVWLALGIVTFVAAVRAAKSTRALAVGRLAVGLLYIVAGALVNTVFLATGEDYADFAKGSYLTVVRDTWRSLVVPNHHFFISLLILFELTVGVLVLSGGRRAEFGLVGAIGFHVALLSFGWGFYLWSIPMLIAFVLLLRAQRRSRVDSDRAAPKRGEAVQATMTGPGVDLYWIPLGAGHHVVRISGTIYEALVALAQRGPRRPLFRSALVATTSEGRFVIEMTEIRDNRGQERGVVAEGAVGTSWLRRFRLFRYEIRRWREGVIPDVCYAVGGPVRITDDAGVTRRVLDLVPLVPTPVWGRDELHAGEMWNSNSVTSWLLATAGVDAAAGPPPSDGRAPGWDAGLVTARRAAPSSRQPAAA